jgi:hypothetical protein
MEIQPMSIASPRPRDPIERARDFGTDLTIFCSSLAFTAEQRMRRLDEDSRFVWALQKRSSTISVLRMIGGLEQAGVRFVVIGRVAGIAHGMPRVTTVMEICCDRAPSNLEALSTVLARWCARPRGIAEDLPFPVDLRSSYVLRLQMTDGDLDLYGHVPGVGDYGACEVESEWIDVPPLRFRALGVDALIRSHRSGAGEIDLESVIELEALRELTRTDDAVRS